MHPACVHIRQWMAGDLDGLAAPDLINPDS
jgi:hypothetical protein